MIQSLHLGVTGVPMLRAKGCRIPLYFEQIRPNSSSLVVETTGAVGGQPRYMATWLGAETGSTD